MTRQMKCYWPIQHDRRRNPCQLCFSSNPLPSQNINCNIVLVFILNFFQTWYALCDSFGDFSVFRHAPLQTPCARGGQNWAQGVCKHWWCATCQTLLRILREVVSLDKCSHIVQRFDQAANAKVEVARCGVALPFIHGPADSLAAGWAQGVLFLKASSWATVLHSKMRPAQYTSICCNVEGLGTYLSASQLLRNAGSTVTPPHSSSWSNMFCSPILFHFIIQFQEQVYLDFTFEASPSVDNCWVHNKLYRSKKINPRGQGQSDTVTVWRLAYLKRYFLSRATDLVMTGGLFRKNTTRNQGLAGATILPIETKPSTTEYSQGQRESKQRMRHPTNLQIHW